jgi:predicted ArsR family transcriptional regulator
MGSRTEKVIDALHSSSAPLTRKEIAIKTGLHVAQVGVALKSLERSQLVIHSATGWKLLAP